MIRKIIDFCGRNLLIVFLCTALALAWSVWAVKETPLDALPDLSDTQVIIFTEWMGRSPNLVEDQITYPRWLPDTCASSARNDRTLRLDLGSILTAPRGRVDTTQRPIHSPMSGFRPTGAALHPHARLSSPRL